MQSETKVKSDDDNGLFYTIVIGMLLVLALCVYLGKSLSDQAKMPPLISKADANTYEWQAKVCMRGVYITYDDDIKWFEKNHPELSVIKIEQTSWFKNDYPATATIYVKRR